MRRHRRSAVLAALLLGAAVVVSGPVAAADPISPEPGTLTFCGVTRKAAFPQPKPDLPKNLQDFNGVFRGTYSGPEPEGSTCLALVFNVSPDGSAKMRMFRGTGMQYVESGSWLKQVTISGGSTSFTNAYGWAVYLTSVDPDHVLLKYHNPVAGSNYSALLERVREEAVK